MYDTERINEIEIGNITFWIHICTHCYEKKKTEKLCVTDERTSVWTRSRQCPRIVSRQPIVEESDWSDQ
jgi:hypothetical protein